MRPPGTHEKPVVPRVGEAKPRRALRWFTKTNKRGLWNIASFHHPDSLTWSWILSIDFDGIWLRWKSRWPRFGCGGYGRNWSIAIPGVVLSWQRQDEMWKCPSVARERSDTGHRDRSDEQVPGNTPDQDQRP